MKKINLIEWLWKTDSHEKQSPQRFARYAAMLIMLLTLGVGQMWGATSTTLYFAHDSWNTAWVNVCTAWNSDSDNKWSHLQMTKLDKTYKGKNLFSVTFTDLYDGARTIEFHESENDWDPKYSPFSGTWTSVGNYNGKMCVSANSWSTYTYDFINLAADFTATAWSTTAYPLTLSAGTYSITVDDVTDSSHKFKITKLYNTWDDAIGYSAKVSGQNLSSGPADESGSTGNNIVFTPSHAGSVKITYNPSTGNIQILAPYQVSYAAGTGATGTVSASAVTTYGSTCTLSSSTFSKTGYTQDGWSTSDGGGKSYNLGGTYTGGYEDVTLYPHWTANEYTTSNNIKESDGSTNAGTYKVNYDATSITYTTAPSKTGYTVEGLYYETSLSNKIVNNDRSLCASTSYTTSGSKWNQTSAPTMYVKWQAKTYSTTNNIKDEDGTTNAGTYTATYDATSIAINTAPTKSGYHVEGYYISTTFTSANKVANASGALEASVSGFTDASRHWIKDANVNLYVHWEEDAANYTLTFGVANSPANDGTLSVTAGGAAASSGSSYVASTSIACTATPGTHSRVKGWYSDNSCVSAIGGAGTGNTYNFSLSANTSVYVGFETATTSITLNGNGGSNTSVTATHGSALPSFSASTRTGYSLKGYYTAESAGTKIINANGTLVASTSYTDASSKWNVKDRTLTLYAQWDEVFSSLSTDCHYDAGNPSYAVPSKTVSSIGIATTSTITATTPSTGYRFVGWTLSNNIVVTSGDKDADLSITVRSNGNGAAATAQANYEEVLTTPYIVTGGDKIVTTGTTWRTGADEYNSMLKASGHSTESVAYFTVPVSATNTGSSNANYKFKIFNTSTSTYYGLNASGQYWVLRENDNGVARTLGDYSDIELRADVTGDYLLKVDYSSTPTLTVYFPLAVTWSAMSVYSGDEATITATVNDIEASKSIKYDVYAGATATGDIIATWSGTTSSTSHSRNLNVTPSFGSGETSKQYTVKVTYDGSQTATYTSYVYRKWDIYVQNNCNWASGVALYQYGNGVNEEWPGVTGASSGCETYGNKNWYKVTLDSKYPNFILDNNQESSGIEQTSECTTGTNTGTYAEDTYWYFAYDKATTDSKDDGKKYYNLTKYTLSAPTVTLAYEVISCTQIKVTGTITGYGGYGSTAAEMEAVGFQKDSDSPVTAASTSGSTFTKYFTGLTAGTEYSIKAYATNVKAKGESSASAITTRASGSYTIHVRIPKANAQPYLYGYTDEEDNGGVKEENDTWPGEAMTLDMTGTVYKWYSKSLGATFNNLIVSENGSKQTFDFNSPGEETCYWYVSSNTNADEEHKRMGSMACPSFDPQLMIETTAGSGSFSYLDMSGSGPYTKQVTLTAKSTYKFKPIYNGEWLGKADVSLDRETYSATGLSADVEDNLEMTTDAAGSYTFTFTAPSSISITYQTAYTVDFGASTGGTISASATSAGATMETGDYVAAGDDVSFTQSNDEGYSFKEWNSQADGEGTQLGTDDEGYDIDDIDENAAVYAIFTENMTHVVLEHNTHGHVENGSGATITSVDAGMYTTASITAVPDAGYYFAGWTLKEGTDFTPSATGEANTTITITGKGDGETTGQTLTANFEELDKIYFRNENETTGGKLWDKDNIYVYFNASWADDGDYSGVVPSDLYARMSPVVSGSKIYWAYVPRIVTKHDQEDNYINIAFSDDWMSNSDYPDGVWDKFYGKKAVYRSDYTKHLNMFVPASLSSGTSNSTVYNSNGYWMKYNTQAAQGAGYYLKESSGAGELSEFTYSAANGTSIVTTYRFENTTAKTFYIANAKGTFYKSDNITSIACSDLDLNAVSPAAGFLVTPTSEGYYTFTIDQSGDTMKISVNYPVSKGDYQLLYTYASGSKTHTSDIIKFDRTVQTNKKSMYIDPTGGVSLKLQKCTGLNESTKQPEWTTGVSVGTLSSVFTSGKGVYVFDLNINNTGKAYNEDPTVSLDNIALYDGPYYIKTDYAPGGWVNYTLNELHQNTINFSKSDDNTFDYYHCAWVGDGKMNVKCIIANDYNEQITDTLIGDDVLGTYKNDKEETIIRQYLAEKANVRFSYNSYTNELKRAYINGSDGWQPSFLMLYGESGKVRKSSSDATTDMTFSDDNNWIYQLDLEASPNARYRLAANYYFNDNNHYQNFKGDVSVDWSTESTEELIGNSTLGDWQALRVIYDFKTNNLIVAWRPSGDVGETINLYTDILLIHNRKKLADPGDEVSMINLTGDYSLTNINKVYSAFRFQKSSDEDYVGLQETPANSAESYYRYNYWISFPYDVKMTDIFGIDGYGSKWRIQRYAGDTRATNGWYKGDGVTSFWETMPLSDEAKLNKGEGYVLQLSPSAFQKTTTGSFWDNSVEEIYLYFPSKENFGSIVQNPSTITLSSLPCTKGAFTDGSGKSHNITDSHWHVFGIPTFYDAEGTTGTGTYYDGDDAEHEYVIDGGVFYFYKYNNDGTTYNTYTATSSSGYTFQPMHAYMIQMTGTLSFLTNSVPASLAARRAPEMKNYDMRLELKSNDVVCDQTFVTLRDSAVADFAFNEDLMKIYNSGKNNIYTYAGPYDVAANILPIESHMINLGVDIAANGYYTFSMPSNFSGEVTLVDRVADKRTNLTFGEYEVYLNKGEINDRFALEINIQKMPTAIDGVYGGSLKDGKAHKFIENGLMYILRDGKVFDAQGRQVK